MLEMKEYGEYLEVYYPYILNLFTSIYQELFYKTQ